MYIVGYAKRSNKGRPVVMDFDDLCDTNDDMDTLKRLKERDPNFKVTLFTIPTRCSDALLTKYDEARDWIALGIHGWRHARHECLAWTSEETEEKIKLAQQIYPAFAPVFKAPNWEICDEVYAGCKSSGVAVADHIRNVLIMPGAVPHYFYNVKLRNDPYTRLHGHIQPYANTGLAEAYDTWSSIPVGSEYMFITEVIAPTKEVGM